jgi:hypothetical protein
METNQGKKSFFTKRTIIGISAAVLLLAFTATSFAITYLKNDWAAKIDNKTISLSDFNNLYYAQLRQQYEKTNDELDKLATNLDDVKRNPILNKLFFLDQLIQTKLFYYRASSEGYLSNPEVKILNEYQRISIIAKFYSMYSLKDKIKITDKEVSDTYTQYQSQFKGAPIEAAEAKIRSVLSQQKFQSEQNKMLQEFRENAQIDRNEELITKLSDPDKSKRPTSGVLVKITGKNISTLTLTVDEFTRGYYAQHKLIYKKEADEIDKLAADPAAVEQNPVLNRKAFIDQLVYQYLFYQGAIKAGMLSNKDLAALVKFTDEQSVVVFYMRDKYSKDAEVTDQEIAAEYERSKKQFPPNVLPDQAEAYIRQNLEQMKFNRKMNEVLTILRERAVIKKNEKLIDPTGSFATQMKAQ